ncbi:MAG: exo-alpha-sialidase [Proteobacteria bacterium]|nr:exo-alpha-sialidase [Pseudomonadota bacterium]HQR04885.1 sialidase family protein [Rhodocyclaceae bacterium]
MHRSGYPLRTLLIALTALTLAASASPSTAHEGHAHTARTDLGASAAFTAGGDLLAVRVEQGRVVLRRSSDLGQHWSVGMPVSPAGEAISAEGENRPKLAVGPGDEIYVSWTQPLAQPYAGMIRFTRSRDGGAHFEPALTVHHDRQAITHRFESLFVDPAGNIFVAWIDKRDLVAARTANRAYTGAALYFAVSTDGGGHFNGDHRVADHSCECCRIALASDGKTPGVLMFWRHIFPPNLRDHALARLHPDGSITGFQRATFDGWAIDACPHHGPALTVDQAGIRHAVWFSERNGEGHVFYGRPGADGVEGQQPVGDASAEHADILATQTTLYMAWKEFDGTHTVLQSARSDDGGHTWANATLARTDGASDAPHLLARGANAYVLWNTLDQGLRILPLP